MPGRTSRRHRRTSRIPYRNCSRLSSTGRIQLTRHRSMRRRRWSMSGTLPAPRGMRQRRVCSCRLWTRKMSSGEALTPGKVSEYKAIFTSALRKTQHHALHPTLSKIYSFGRDRSCAISAFALSTNTLFSFFPLKLFGISAPMTIPPVHCLYFANRSAR